MESVTAQVGEMEHNLSRTVSIAKFYEIKKFQRISIQLDEIFLLTNLILILTIFQYLDFFVTS